jgi:hypothetical protein
MESTDEYKWHPYWLHAATEVRGRENKFIFSLKIVLFRIALSSIKLQL